MARHYAQTMKAKLLLMLVLLPFAAAAAQGYKIVHPDGSVEFTDQPVKNAEEINLPDAQGYESLSNGATSAQGKSAPTATPDTGDDYAQFTIASPQAEETIFNTGGSVSVALSVSPPLKEGHQVVITLDGKEAAKGQSSSLTLSEVERGAHQLSASLVNSAGLTLRQASPVTFYVFQQSLLNPANPNFKP